jgi:hypothetical protein
LALELRQRRELEPGAHEGEVRRGVADLDRGLRGMGWGGGWMIGEGTAAAAAGRRGGRDDRSRRNRIAAIEASILFYLFLPLAI